MRAKVAIAAGVAALLAVLWAVRARTVGSPVLVSREVVERQLGFYLPPSAGQWKLEELDPGGLDDHTLVSFTIQRRDLDRLLPQLPCTPSADGSLKEWSHLAGTPLAAGELGCTQLMAQHHWTVVRVAPGDGASLRVLIEQYADY